MKNFFLKYSSKISISLLVIITVLSLFELMKFKMWGIYLILNGFLCFGLFIVNGKPIWVGFGGFNYGVEKFLKKGYNRYLNLTISVISLILGFGIVWNE